MTGDQWAQIITAFFGGIASLMLAFPVFWLAMRNINKPVVAAVEAIPVALVEAQKPVVEAVAAIPVAIAEAAVKTAESISENTALLQKVEVQTNSNLTEAKILSDELRAEAISLAAATAESKQQEYATAMHELETLRAENMRLATAAAPLQTPTQELRP